MLSIVTPVLNGSQFIESNIQSIMSLNIPYEHIIVDGGSTDGTLDIIHKYPHVRLIHQKGNNGMYEAIHQGFLKAKGNIFTYVNVDDTIIQRGYKKMYNHFVEKSDVMYSDAVLIDENNNKKIKVKGSRLAKYFLKKGILPFIQPSSIFSKEAYWKVGGFNYNSFRICGDLDFFYRLSLYPNSKFHYCPIVSSCFLVRKNSLGNMNSDKVIIEKIKNEIPAKNHIIDRILFRLSKKI